jgi:hypothetical protein
MITNRDSSDHGNGHGELPDLTALDPAVRTLGDRATSPAAQQMLTRILQTPRVAPSPPGKPTGEGGKTRAHDRHIRSAVTRHRRWALTGGAAAALTAAGIVLPAVTDGSGAAFASWTPIPSAVPPDEAASWQEQCLATGPDPQGPVTTSLSERRGGFTFTLMVTDQAVGTCLLLDPAGAEGTTEEERGAISWGPSSDLPAPATGSATVQPGATFRSAVGEFTSAFGRVDEQVVAVQLTPDGGRPVQATLGDGYFTAWWPGQAGDHLSVTLTHTDGTKSVQEL